MYAFFIYLDDGTDSQNSSIYLFEFVTMLMTVCLCCIGCIAVFILGGVCGFCMYGRLSQGGGGKAQSYQQVANMESV